ncbi:uncharacterized protein LOC122839859 isoform X3 [Gambusia affinis]|uniref:uncharacterized protein LOC122839859 isoform X2 n=1 Tax=Gambusia affinis TaxID=33528 RepID=UPI001CDC0A92|nr:uncharacterized protein LOC122839859 isoform X2 [Gambusia affinis]XP_043987795.1 uncharacterized protein LOC122839859 isoform X3 [Gambusia affinis]
MELPADGSPMLEGLPDNGKEDGKLCLNGANMVSEDHGEELRYSSPPQPEDCSTSTTGSSSSSSTGSSSSSSTGSSSSSSTGSSSTSSSEDEVGNGDQDFRSRFRVVQVVQPNIKFLWGIGVLEQALERLKSTVDQLGSGDSSPVVLANVALQLPEILPHNFKYIQDIGVAQKPQEDMAPSTCLEFPSGLDKQEEPILRPEKSSPIGTLQHPQVGLKEDAAHVTSVTGINGKRRKNSDDEEQPPAKRSRQTVTELELAIKSIVQSFPSQEMEYEDPVVLPPVLCLSPLMSCEDPGLSSPILSPSCKSPVFSSPVLSPSTLTHCEDPILSPSVFGLLPWMPCEDPILSPLVSPSSTHFPDSNCSSPDFRFGMDTEEEAEEEAIPSTSSGITARESSRHLWFRPHYDLSGDSD